MQRLVFIHGRPRNHRPEQDIVLGDLALDIRLGIAGTVCAALLLLPSPGASAFALVHDLDRQRFGPVSRAAHLGLRGADRYIARCLRQEHVGNAVTETFGNRPVYILHRRTGRDARPGNHVEAFERRGLERVGVRFGVQRELHAESLADGDHQRRTGLKSDLLGS